MPDSLPSPVLEESLVHMVRLLQTAFWTNKTEVAIMREKEGDGSKPTFMVGNTLFTQKNGLDVTKLRDWSLVHRVEGRDTVNAVC